MERKTTTNRIKTSMIPDLKKAIRALAKTPPEDASLKAAVRQAIPDIHEARAAGRSFDDIAIAFAGFGLKITGSTLRSYIHDEMCANAAAPAGKEARESPDNPSASSAISAEEAPSSTPKPRGLIFEDIVDNPEEVSETSAAPAATSFPTKSPLSPDNMDEELEALNASLSDDTAAPE